MTPPGELPIISFFGRTEQRLAELAEHWGCSHDEAFKMVLWVVHELCDSGPKELEIVRQFAFVVKAIEDQGGDFDDLIYGLWPSPQVIPAKNETWTAGYRGA